MGIILHSRVESMCDFCRVMVMKKVLAAFVFVSASVCGMDNAPLSVVDSGQLSKNKCVVESRFEKALRERDHDFFVIYIIMQQKGCCR